LRRLTGLAPFLLDRKEQSGVTEDAVNFLRDLARGIAPDLQLVRRADQVAVVADLLDVDPPVVLAALLDASQPGYACH
jgi:hypothetical protein